MPIENKIFNGIMNYDDPNDALPARHHRTSSNAIFRGNPGNTRMESTLGNRLVTNSYLPSGVNQTIGTFYDSLNNRVFIFNYNSLGHNGIYVFNTQTETFQTLIQCGANTDGDILGFNLTTPIDSINLIYGDNTDGDLLSFVDSLKRPTKLNVERYLANTYSFVKRSYIDVAKMPPSNPIKSVYACDTTYTGNNLKNGLFQFIYRFVYDDNETSVWSTGSKTALPFLPNNDGTAGNAKFLNNNIKMYFDTGDVNVKKIEVAFRQTREGATSLYSLIQSFDKTLLSIPNNDLWEFNFYNDGVYIPVLETEQILLFDYVPLKANTQELLNGSVLIYGGITEGYANVPVTASISQSTTTDNINSRNGLLFFAESISSNSIKIVLDGTIGSSAGTLAALPNTTFNVYARTLSNTDMSFYYTESTQGISSAIAGLSAAAIAAGYTVTTSTNSLIITHSNIVLCGTIYRYNYSTIANPNWDVLYTLYANSSYQYGIVYYDADGKTNGVNTSTGLKLTTQVGGAFEPETQILTKRTLTINNTPPSWAAYYQVVRTSNLNYGDKALYWVSSGSFSDKDVSVAPPIGQQYSYLRIDNIYDYNLQIKATEGVVGYTFTTGDRVRFIKRFNALGVQANDYSGMNLDYEILSVDTNPVMNGIAKDGAYIKIYYPTNDISSTFAFDGTPDFQNYEIFIYNKASVISTSQQTYFEIGEKYDISNGLHLGNIQSQTGSQPAIIDFQDGDVFYRNRNVVISPSYQINAVGISNYSNSYVTYQIGDSSQDITTTNYNIGHSINTTASLAYGVYPQFSDPNYNYWNKSSVDYNVRFKFSFEIHSSNSELTTSISAYIKTYNASNASYVKILNPQQVNVINVEYPINIDAIVKVPAGYKAMLIFTNDSNVIDLHSGAFTMTVTPLNTINIEIDDASFSDVYNVKTNSNSRPLVVDINAKQSYFPTTVRYSQSYQQGTSINGTNRFYFLDSDDYDRKFGDIMRMRLHNKDLRIFQFKKCGVVPVFSVETLNQDGTNNLVASSKIINPIRYYEGDFGIGNQPSSLCTSGYADYFCDPVKGYLLRLSQDGLTPISQTYKMQTFTGNNLTNYLSNHAYATGGYSKVLGVFHFSKDRSGEYISMLQGSTDLTPYTLSFDEQKNCFTTFYDFHPDWAVCYENVLATFKGGNIYIHDSNTCNNFYGTQYNTSISLVFNEQNIVKKTFNFITMDSSDIYIAPSITTVLGQSSNLVADDYELQEGLYSAAFMRDANSLGGIINGDYLKGTWIQVTLQQVNASNFVYLSGLYLGYQVSPRNY